MPELAEDPRFTDFKKYLEVIIRESYRCKGIIDSLLSFSRKSDGSLSDVDINQLLREVLQLVRHKSRFEKIEIHESFEENIPAVQGDTTGLRQVFLNLTMNALQSIEGAGFVEIVTQSTGETVSATICDTGCGIPPALMDQIWDPFFTTKDVGKGLGLGLAVTYNIIKKHGGEILVESVQGKGSKFTVRLPVCQA